MLKDSVYLVTGGASGLGKATAEILLQSGAKVAICDINLPEKNDPIYLYKENELLVFHGDVTSEEDIEKLFEEIKKKFGKLNGIINCAGSVAIEPIYNFEKKEPHSMKTFHKITNVNLGGTFNVIRLGIPLLVDSVRFNQNKEQAVIINTSSYLGHRGFENTIAYSVSKAAIIGMTIPLARELRDYGIRVVDIAPGLFDTPMAKGFNMKVGNKLVCSFPDRLGQPKEFGELVKSIIEIQFINGASLRIDALPQY